MVSGQTLNIRACQDIILKHNPSEYYKIYAREEEQYWEHIPKWILGKKISNCLDIGIAYGTLALFVKLNNENCNFYGIDMMQYISSELVSAYNIDYLIANIEKEDIQYNVKFDAILFTEIFEHLNFHPISTLLKLKEMLSDDGVIFFSTPDSDSWGKLGYYNSWKDIPYVDKNQEVVDAHIYQYNMEELKEIFEIVGLTIDKSGTSKNSSGLKHINLQLSKK